MATALLVAIPVVMAACGSSNAGSVPPLGTTIGPAGGSLVVGSGLLQLDVPAAALAADTIVGVTTGVADSLAGWQVVSSSYEFSPSALAFAVPATLTMPYAASRVAASVGASELRVALQTSAAAPVRLLEPLFAGGGALGVEVAQLGTFWVVAPDVVDADQLWPRNNGDTYTYDSGLVLDLARTIAEPNLGAFTVLRATISDGTSSRGWYFDDRSGQLAFRGVFDARLQQVWDTSALLVRARDAVASDRASAATYDEFAPFGATTPTSGGIAVVATAILDRPRIDTPLGAFATVRVAIAAAANDQDGGVRNDRIEFWFARGVGPVALRVGDGPMGRLVSATVGGVVVAPR